MSPSKPRILIILTSHTPGWYLVAKTLYSCDFWGLHAEHLHQAEFAHPWSVFAPVFDITVASPMGGEAPIDPSSLDAAKTDDICATFLRDQEQLWKNTRKLEKFVDEVKDFDAVFFVGGYGPMFDLADTPATRNIVLGFHASHKTISSICHGAAPLAHLKVPRTGEYLLKGHRITGISKTEIALMPTHVPVPFELEDALNEASGGGYEKATEPWGEKVVVSTVDGQAIITGQTPSSGLTLAKEVVKAVLANRS